MKTTLHARLELHYADEEAAEAAAAALAPENGSYVSTRREGATLFVEVHEARLQSAAASVDDVLACLGAVQRADDAARSGRGAAPFAEDQ